MYLQQLYNQAGQYKASDSHSIRTIMHKNHGDARIYEFFSYEGEVIFSVYLGRVEIRDMLCNKPLKDCARLYFRMFAGPEDMALTYEKYLKCLVKESSTPIGSFVHKTMERYGYSVSHADVQEIIHEIHKWLAIKNMV